MLLYFEALPYGRWSVGAEYGGAVIEEGSHVTDVGGPERASMAAHVLPAIACRYCRLRNILIFKSLMCSVKVSCGSNLMPRKVGCLVAMMFCP